MSEISVTVPDSIMQELQSVIREEGINLEQSVSSAIAEKLSAFMSEKYLQERAKRGSREKFLAVLDRANNGRIVRSSDKALNCFLQFELRNVISPCYEQ